MTAKKIIKEIAKKQKQLKLSDSKLAKKCKVHRLTIGKMKKFKHNPDIGTLIKICKPLGLELYLIDSLNNCCPGVPVEWFNELPYCSDCKEQIEITI